MNKSLIAFMKAHEEIESPSPRYRLIQNRASCELLLVQTVYLQNIPLLKLRVKTLDQHLPIKHEYILPLLRYFVSEAGQLTLTAVYEAGPHTLAEEVEARALERKYFKEN